MKCDYGCGEEANYMFKNGKWCCSDTFSKCPAYRKRKSDSLKREHKEGKRGTKQFDGKRGGSKGLTKETDERLAKQAETYKRKHKEGKIKSVGKGKHLSKEHRENISKGRMNSLENSSNFGFVKTKYYSIYSIYCPYINDYVNVQGTGEYNYAVYLNENNIKGIHSRKYVLKYKNDIERNYFPDFYLPELDEYHEIKGGFMDSDKEKMKYVIKCNRDKKIRILQRKQLERLNIDLSSKIKSTSNIDLKILKHEITGIQDKVTVLKSKIDNDLLYERRKALETSNIDLMKYGWVSKVAILGNMHPQKVSGFIKKYYPDLIFFERKRTL